MSTKTKKPKIPRGWRKLRVGTKARITDKVWKHGIGPFVSLRKLHCTGKIEWYHAVHIRRIAKKEKAS